MTTMIALGGNPNCGKSTLFNALTGARQHVGNYPGVTVEKKQGHYHVNGDEFTLVDLPGIYSLSAYSVEEVVARDFIFQEKPRIVIDIVDAANLERNLYLTLQFMEMGIPVCVALNMMDVARQRGITIDVPKLSVLLGVPVVETVARNGSGKERLMAIVAQMAANGKETVSGPAISYGSEVDGLLNEMAPLIAANHFLTDCYPARWVALKYIENDIQIIDQGRCADAGISRRLEERVARLSDHLQKTLHTQPDEVIADYRYGYIRSLLAEGVIRYGGDRSRLFISDQVDKVVVHRFLGPLIMLAVLFALYQFTFSLSGWPVAWVESFFGWIGALSNSYLPEGPLKSLIISGIVEGVGGVLGFVPLIMFMFFGIAVLEDSGYLARVAFMLDRVFRIFGLHGNSVMAFIVSGGIAGGCAVPGVLATRTLKSPRERLATLLTVPFMNCGAKLPVFALLVGAFFAKSQALVMFLLTLVAWAGALFVAKLLRSTVIRGEATPFVMELPPYRVPTFKGLVIHTWERTWQYIKKAGTVILGISILLWAAMTFPGLPAERAADFERQRQAIVDASPTHAEASRETAQVSGMNVQLKSVDMAEAEAALRHSLAGRLGTTLESLSQWAGFDWRTNIALIGGFAAKEVIVSTLGTAYSLGEVDPEHSGSLAQTLAHSPKWRPLTALSLIVFVMFYAPCFVSVVCIARESGSFKWGLFSMVFNTCLAFTLAIIVYQIGRVLGL